MEYLRATDGAQLREERLAVALYRQLGQQRLLARLQPLQRRPQIASREGSQPELQKEGRLCMLRVLDHLCLQGNEG